MYNSQIKLISGIEELSNVLANRDENQMLPIWLQDGVAQYLELSAQEKEEMALICKASFAVQKRNWTCAHLNSAKKMQYGGMSLQNFVLWAVEFLDTNLQKKDLLSLLSRKWKKFVEMKQDTTISDRSVDYLLTTVFL